jgi:TRAP-type C4-dicarboxylate transport system permease small subunit
MKIVAIVLVVAGILALAYGGFTYKKETHEAQIGPVGIQVTEKERMDVPVWAGVAMIVVGGGLLVAGRKK